MTIKYIQTQHYFHCQHRYHQFRLYELLCHIVDRVDSLFSLSLSFSIVLPLYRYHYHSFFLLRGFFPRFFSHARFSNRIESTSAARIRKRKEARVERGEMVRVSFFDKRKTQNRISL